MPHAGNHAHDRVLHLSLVQPFLTELLTNRVLIWKKRASEIVIDYDDKRFTQDIVTPKDALLSAVVHVALRRLMVKAAPALVML